MIVEREILEQIRELQKQLGFAVMFITHDLARMLEFSDRVAVFYAARLVEVGPAAAMVETPSHPYTQGLLKAFPRVHSVREGLVSNSRLAAQPDEPAVRLPLSPALRPGGPGVQREPARAARGEAGTSGGLSFCTVAASGRYSTWRDGCGLRRLLDLTRP